MISNCFHASVQAVWQTIQLWYTSWSCVLCHRTNPAQTLADKPTPPSQSAGGGVGEIRLAQAVCNFINNDTEQKTTSEEADLYFSLRQCVRRCGTMNGRGKDCKTGNPTITRSGRGKRTNLLTTEAPTSRRVILNAKTAEHTYGVLCFSQHVLSLHVRTPGIHSWTGVDLIIKRHVQISSSN